VGVKKMLPGKHHISLVFCQGFLARTGVLNHFTGKPGGENQKFLKFDCAKLVGSPYPTNTWKSDTRVAFALGL
jgi:hypothetical protein